MRLDPSITLSQLRVSNSANGYYFSDSSANNWVGRGALTTGKAFSSPSSSTYYSITPLSYYFNTACGGTGVAFIRAEATAYVSRVGTSWNYKVSLNKTN